MVHFVLLKKRKEGVSREEFEEFMVEEHAKESIAELPNITSYRAMVPVDPEETEWDSIEIHTYESVEDRDEALDTDVADEGHERLKKAVDLDSELAILAEELVSMDDIN